MNLFHLSSPFLAALALLVGGRVDASADETTQVIAFSDPAKPGTVKVNLGRGDLRIQGSDTTEVTVHSDSKAAASEPRQDGLRVLSAASSFSLKENNNIITLDSSNEWSGRANAHFSLTVPRSTTLIVQNAWGGNIQCSGLTGDIEINSMQGEIELNDISGGVVVGTMNGAIKATIRELNEKKPLSFTSMNGEVVLHVPEAAKANVRLRTQNGTVLTDFPETALVTRTEAVAGFPRGKTPFIKGGKVLTTEIQDAIREAAQLSATAVKEALEAIKEGLEAARLDSDEARRQMEEAKHQMERARRDLERARRETETQAAATSDRPAPAAPAKPRAPAAPAVPPLPAKPALPTLTGGKLVTGALNGGGPEISVSTMNGDVILRKLAGK